MVLKIIVLLFMVAQSQAQIYTLGECPEYKPKQQFQLNRFLGKWYTIYKYDNILETIGIMKCNTATYTKNNDDKINVEYKMNNALTFIPVSFNGTAKFARKKHEAKFISTLVGPFVEFPFWILETDYNNYAVIYSCYSFRFAKAESLWIVSRRRIPSQFYIDKAWAFVNETGLNTDQIKVCDQSFCFFT